MGAYYIAYDLDKQNSLSHHQVRGAHWGIHRGPPYPLSRNSNGSLNAKKQAERKRNSKQVYGSSRSEKMQNGTVSAKKTETDAELDPETGLKLKKKTLRSSVTGLIHSERAAAADLAAVNPMIPPRSNGQFNCAYCTLAYDLRRRGYDVMSANKCGMTNDDISRLYKGQKVDWFLPESAYNKTLKPSKKQSAELNKWIRSEISKQGRNSSGMFSVAFDNDCTHSMTYENRNGKIRILDAQQNRVYDLDKLTPCIVDAMISRTDNLEPDFKVIKELRAVKNV